MDTDALRKRIELLEKQISSMQAQRITQSSILPDVVKTRHMGEPNRYFMSGLLVDRPSGATIGQGATYYFATDQNKLYCWNGTAWVSTTLAP